MEESSLAGALDHDDATPLIALLSVMVQSAMGRTPESMGEETVQSITGAGATSVQAESVMAVGASMTSEVAESDEG